MKHLLALIMSCLCASPLVAHPHIFIDTGLDLTFDDKGYLVSVRTTWAYDELYSLLVTEHHQLDQDFDGVLTEAELAVLTGFDMQWAEGFNGDLEITQGGRVLNLSGPREATAQFKEGRIITTHLREVNTEQQTGEPLYIRPYDETYYTAYDVTYPVRIVGTDACKARVEMPDINADLMELRKQIEALDMYVEPEEAGLPNIGGLLATTVKVTCATS